MFDGRGEHETLDVNECLRLLGGHTLGRVSLSLNALPVIVPVFYDLVGDQLAFWIRRDNELSSALTDNVVAFEVDDVDLASRNGWSVLVVGRSGIAPDPPPAALRAAHRVLVDLDRVSGFRTAAP